MSNLCMGKQTAGGHCRQTKSPIKRSITRDQRIKWCEQSSFSFLTPPAWRGRRRRERRRRRDSVSPKQTEGLCIVLSVSTASTEGDRTRRTAAPVDHIQPELRTETTTAGRTCDLSWSVFRTVECGSVRRCRRKELGRTRLLKARSPGGGRERDMNPSSA